MTAPAGLSGLLDEAMLVNARWRYGHQGKAPETLALRLLPGGAIAGYAHPNERFWQLQDGILSLLRADRTCTVRFDDVSGGNGSLLLRGKYLGDPASGIVLQLEQVQPVAEPPAPIVEEVIATLTSPGFDLMPPDLRQRGTVPDSVLRVLDPIWARGHFSAQPVRFSLLLDVFVAKEGLVFTADMTLVPASVTQHSEGDIAWARRAIAQALADRTMPDVAGTCVLCKKRGVGNYGHWPGAISRYNTRTCKT